jgi:hypothetical protein
LYNEVIKEKEGPEMGSLSDDLDRFLRTDGLRIIYDSQGIRTEPYESLTEENIDDFDSMDLSNLSEDELVDLYEKADDLLDDLEGKEPEDENSEEYSLWYGRLSATKDLIDRIEEQLNNLEDDE